MHKKRILVQSNGSGPQCRLFLTFCWRWKTRQQIAVLSLDVRPWPGQDQSKKEPVSWSNMSFCEVAKTSTDWWWQLNWEISQPMWRNHSQHINISNWSTCTNPSSCVCDYTSAASEFQVRICTSQAKRMRDICTEMLIIVNFQVYLRMTFSLAVRTSYFIFNNAKWLKKSTCLSYEVLHKYCKVKINIVYYCGIKLKVTWHQNFYCRIWKNF